MSDIDFDELDKAVNSLVGDDSDVKQNNTPSVSQSSATKNDSLEKEEKVSPTLPTRRAGRFMDMKHDSSDMQKKDSSLMTPSKTSIAPINPGIKKELEEDKKVQPETKPKSDWPDPIDSSKNDDEKSEDKEALPNVSTDMPDPLDHMSKNIDTVDKDSVDKDDEERKDRDEPVIKPSDEKDEPELDYEETETKKDDKKESPFIDDAKVDKRPLGGFSSESPVDPPSEVVEKKDKKNEDALEDDTKKEDGIAQPAPEPIELPPELDKDLVAIEAGEALEVQKPVEQENEAVEKNDKQDEGKSDEKDDKESEKKNQKDTVSELLASAATGSIPEQYKRQNRSHELHAPHPLFDADHYKNAPKDASAKKPKSLVKKVFQMLFIFLGIALLGGFLGTAFFVFVSQQ